MRNRKKRWNGRARGAPPVSEFERALMGDENADRPRFDPRHDRKTLQLCRQVQRALALALIGECDDDPVSDLVIESVEPLGGAGQLLVRIAMPREHLASATDVLARLNSRSPQLRAEIANAISRKRVPGLSFVAVPMTEGDGHERCQ